MSTTVIAVPKNVEGSKQSTDATNLKKKKVKQSSFCSKLACTGKKKSVLNNDEIIRAADHYLQALFNQQQFSGSVLIAKDGEILLIKGYGCADYTSSLGNNSQTVFRIGSVTKPFTATIVMKLYELNLLSLNDPLSKYVPDFANGEQIKIKHLVSNTSGIIDYTETSIFMESLEKNLPIDRVIDIFRNEPLQFTPGSKYAYSNSNFILLGNIIEKVTGKSYEENLYKFILEPCCMNDSGYDCDHDTSTPKQQIVDSNITEQKQTELILETKPHEPLVKKTKRACGYICHTDPDGLGTCRFIDMSLARAAGGIYSTVEDLYKFDRCLYNETILRRATKKVMFKPVKEDYALGWRIEHPGSRLPWLRHLCIAHEGEIFGFMSAMARFPKDNAFIAVLSNFEHTDIAKIRRDLTDILYGLYPKE
ncbi:unnamed protein product [Didymodactylos carnosus]|uniref:Beta-lactamase-related domain-containing protein n=1 Tax=Didymodactylos carnosus TaxID=1234261 RepID=A0A814AHD7_9BILA|nr:unnamed protein product [Didymodactylos carnosus]CAF3695299.1 unnamed protein product [Didymodactylos carnosus]